MDKRAHTQIKRAPQEGMDKHKTATSAYKKGNLFGQDNVLPAALLTIFAEMFLYPVKNVGRAIASMRWWVLNRDQHSLKPNSDQDVYDLTTKCPLRASWGRAACIIVSFAGVVYIYVDLLHVFFC